jgi:hypothetical protein
MDGWCPERCEDITESEELEHAVAEQERMEAHNWKGQGQIWAVVPQERERERDVTHATVILDPTVLMPLLPETYVSDKM